MRLFVRTLLLMVNAMPIDELRIYARGGRWENHYRAIYAAHKALRTALGDFRDALMDTENGDVPMVD